ncbi:MAG TPA: hypothetical protein PLS29_01755 [Acidimicrobiales bacterium]|nr:hypothetical protein [Acidimicrobiales bacterium]
MSLQLRRWPPHGARAFVATMAVAVLLGAGSSAGASTSSSVALRIAQYAVATATHDRPARVVNGTDITNAASINTVNTTGLVPTINLGGVFEYPRLVLFIDPKTFATICLNMPDTVGGAPRAIPCPHRAQGLWSGRARALAVSDRAIADAAAKGRAVSGADVVAAAKVYGVTLRHKPTFPAGRGAIVQFSTLVEMGPTRKFSVNNCVQLPMTAYGIPKPVPC